MRSIGPLAQVDGGSNGGGQFASHNKGSLRQDFTRCNIREQSDRAFYRQHYKVRAISVGTGGGDVGSGNGPAPPVYTELAVAFPRNTKL